MAKKVETKEEIIKSYVEAKVKIRALEAIANARKEQIKALLLEEKDHEIYVESSDATLKLQSRPVYEYSKKIQLKEETLKEEQDILKMMKKEEEETGKAKLVDDGWYAVVK